MSEEMKKFNVGFYYEEKGFCVVEAKTAKDAERIMNERLSADGVEDLVFDCTDRDYDTTSSSEIDSDLHVTPGIKYIPEEKIVNEDQYDVEISIMDINEDPTTPYHQEIVLIDAYSESEALKRAREMAYSMPETAGYNVSVECEIV